MLILSGRGSPRQRAGCLLLQEADLDAELENCHHYMQFAAAAYGWPLYIYRNPFTGLCKIGGDW